MWKLGLWPRNSFLGIQYLVRIFGIGSLQCISKLGECRPRFPNENFYYIWPQLTFNCSSSIEGAGCLPVLLEKMEVGKQLLLLLQLQLLGQQVQGEGQLLKALLLHLTREYTVHKELLLQLQLLGQQVQGEGQLL
jgi:hypothetical protein